MLLTATPTPRTPCPRCKALLDLATLTRIRHNRTRPRRGDVTVCIRCLAVLLVLPGLTVRRFTAREVLGKLTIQELVDLHHLAVATALRNPRHTRA